MWFFFLHKIRKYFKRFNVFELIICSSIFLSLWPYKYDTYAFYARLLSMQFYTGLLGTCRQIYLTGSVLYWAKRHLPLIFSNRIQNDKNENQILFGTNWRWNSLSRYNSTNSWTVSKKQKELTYFNNLTKRIEFTNKTQKRTSKSIFFFFL